MFPVDTIATLPDLLNDELKELETQVQAEFKSTTKEYLSSRLSRINLMLKRLNEQAEECREIQTDWDKIFEFETATVNSVKHRQENICLNGKSAGDTYDRLTKEINELRANKTSPLTLDRFLQGDQESVFEPQMKEFKAKYATELTTLLKESQYQEKLVDKHSENNRIIIWQQFRANLINYKNYLINKNMDELIALYKRENNYTVNEQYSKNWDKYHNSVIPSGKKFNDFKDTKDFISNKVVKNNRIELTNIKRDTVRRLKKQKLQPCAGLTEDEIDQDIAMMKASYELDEESAPDTPDEYSRLMEAGYKELAPVPPLEQL